MKRYVAKTIDSPVGPLRLVASDTGLAAVLWPRDDAGRVELPPVVDGEHRVLSEAARQLREYFAGRREAFAVPLDFVVGTPFQQRVWAALLTIPYGETRSYRELAMQIGSPKAVRAVGAANGRNPLSIVVPCHRVIGTNGRLTGFAGGLAAKQFLLDLETRCAREDRAQLLARSSSATSAAVNASCNEPTSSSI